MKFLTLIFIIIFIFVVFNDNIVFGNNYYVPQEKDPFIAGLLSAGMMGLGQFYAKEYTKGSLFVLADFIQKGSLIFLIANFNKKYTDEDNGDTVVEWSEISIPDKFLIIGYLTFYFGTQVFCIVDAMKSAENYNKSLKKMQESKFNVGFMFNNHSSEVGINYRSKF